MLGLMHRDFWENSKNTKKKITKKKKEKKCPEGDTNLYNQWEFSVATCI